MCLLNLAVIVLQIYLKNQEDKKMITTMLIIAVIIKEIISGKVKHNQCVQQWGIAYITHCIFCAVIKNVNVDLYVIS